MLQIAAAADPAPDGAELISSRLDGQAFIEARVTREAWSSVSLWLRANVYLWFTGQMSGQPIACGLRYGGQLALSSPGLRLAIATTNTPPLLGQLPQQMSGITALMARLVATAA